MTGETYPYELRLELAPYRFEWANEEPVDCEVRQTSVFNEECYHHADGTVVVIRNYLADGSFHLLSDRGEIEFIDHARNRGSPQSVSVVRLP
jgi:hypothetical protein